MDSSDDFKIREISKSSRHPPDKKSPLPRAMPPCLAIDPQHPNRAYWVLDNGLLKTDDRGQGAQTKSETFNLNIQMFNYLDI